jgi:hypothetical protein
MMFLAIFTPQKEEYLAPHCNVKTTTSFQAKTIVNRTVHTYASDAWRRHSWLLSFLLSMLLQ